MARTQVFLFALLVAYLQPAIASTKEFVSKDFWAQISTNCSTELRDVGSCLSSTTKTSVRNEAADRYSSCFVAVLEDYFECGEVASTKASEPFWKEFIPDEPLSPLNLTINATCNFPEPQKILEAACIYDIEELPRSNCCANEKGEKDPCAQQSTNFIHCQQAAIQQYVRCTGRENPSDNLTECVSISERVPWLPDGFLVYSGAKVCPKTSDTLLVLGLANAFSFICALLSIGIPLLWKRMRGTAEEKTTQMKLGFIAIFWTLLLDLSKPVILALLSRRAGYRVDLLLAILLWSVRPRSAALIGILGFFHPKFMENALSKMISDLVFSTAAGAFAVFVAVFPNRSRNPKKPKIYKYYQAGGTLMLIPSIIISFAMLMAAIDHCKLFTVVKYPFREGYTKLRNVRRKEEDKIPEKTVEFQMFKSYYYQFLLLSVILFVGSWMVWSTFLIMAGDLYCPASMREISIILFTFPVIENVVKLLLGCFG